MPQRERIVGKSLPVRLIDLRRAGQSRPKPLDKSCVKILGNENKPCAVIAIGPVRQALGRIAVEGQGEVAEEARRLLEQPRS